MTIDDDQQAVADDADAPPGEGAEDSGAQVDDVDAALAEFTDKTAQEETTTDTPKPDEADDELASRVVAIENRYASEELGKAVSTIKDAHDHLSGVDPNIIEGRLRLESARDPRVEEAFKNQSSNPDGWNKVVKAIGDKIAKEVGAVADPQLTNDRDAMRDAVNTQSTNASDGPSQAEISAMSDEEYNAHMEAGFRA